MPKPRTTHTKETVSKSAGKPKAKIGKAGPLTDSIDWKKPFGAWIKGKSDDLRGPIQGVIGKMSPPQLVEAINFLAQKLEENDDIGLFEEIGCAFDPSKFSATMSESQFNAILSILEDPDHGTDHCLVAMAFLSVCDPPAKTEKGHSLGPSERKFTALLTHHAYELDHNIRHLLVQLSRESPRRLKIFLQALHTSVEQQLCSRKRRYREDFIIDLPYLLVEIGNKDSIPTLRLLVESCRKGVIGNVVALESSLDALERLGANPVQENEDFLDSLEKDQSAIYNLLTSSRDIKQLVLEGSDLLELLPNPQAWVTINTPGLAREAVRLVVQKLGTRINKLDNVLSQSLGVRSKNLKSIHFTFYADEILDAVFQVSQMKQLRNDPELSAVLAQVKYSNGVKLRFARREKSDLSLGDKCGDCTAKGSVNFGNSVTWSINPAYNILKMSSGKHFIGKMNITLGKIAGEEAVIIDALEFNPQAAEGMPLYDEAVNCFEETISFLKQLAESQNRSLFALTFSNSGGAQTLLRNKGFHPVFIKGEGVRFPSPEEAAEKSESVDVTSDKLSIQLLIPSEDICRIMKSAGYSENPKLFYQMVDTTGAISASGSGEKDRMEEKLPLLEREVLNPAQIENPEIAKAMRERDFEEAARLIFADENWIGKFRKVFNISPSMKISPMFLAKKMERIYAADALGFDDLKKIVTVNIDNFVKL